MTDVMYPIELLAPAKDVACGVAAVGHGADAVYIGASRFGARKLAGNSVVDIAKLVAYAHLYRAKVYATVNTLLFDGELEDARTMIWELYDAGIDALIVQDMGVLMLDLPPVALHASTQTDNRTPEKVKFLEDVGFEQVILARELSLEQIAEIRRRTSAVLEFFVHGALCVSYSGKCYMSHAVSERSANRGECSQLCRLPYSVETLQGKSIVKNKYVLSLKDLNLSEYLEMLADAGVTSFKIEGRLKDVGYVKNVTAFYRQKLDAMIERRDGMMRSSSGKSEFVFNPVPERSFSRGFTSFFINGRQRDICTIDTPKSTGERIGKVTETGNGFFSVATDGVELHNGDGLCFFNRNGVLTGIGVNRVENGKVFAQDCGDVYVSATVYRNSWCRFNRLLQQSSGNRRIGIHIAVSETSDGVCCRLTDEDGVVSVTPMPVTKMPANNWQKAEEQIKTQISKLGNTPFYPLSVSVDFSEPLFLQTAVINALRREATLNHCTKRMEAYVRVKLVRKPVHHVFPEKLPPGESNVLNRMAAKFYREHGIENAGSGFELLKPTPKQRVMTAKHCVRYMLGICPKEKHGEEAGDLVLKSDRNSYLLKFECTLCEMHIFTL